MAEANVTPCYNSLVLGMEAVGQGSSRAHFVDTQAKSGGELFVLESSSSAAELPSFANPFAKELKSSQLDVVLGCLVQRLEADTACYSFCRTKTAQT